MMQREQVHMLVDTLLDLHKTFLAKVPPEAASHFQVARRETLLGVRALVDGAISRMETPDQAKESGRDSTQIPVE